MKLHDLIYHLLGFCLITIFCYYFISRPGGIHIAIVSLFLFAVGLAIEIIDYFIGDGFSGSDLFLDAIGIGLGWFWIIVINFLLNLF